EEYELWPDGHHHWVLSTKLPLRDEHDEIIGTFGLSRDISALKLAQKRMEAKVAELEQLDADFSREQRLFSALIENIPDAVYFKDRNCRFIRVNPAMATDAGFRNPDELVGLTDANIWGSSLPAEAFADELRIMETGEPIVGKQEEVIRRTDNERRWVLSTKMPLRDAGGRIVGTFGLARDITTLKVTQEWLSESQERFEFAVQGTTDGLWDWNIRTDEVWYAPRFKELLQLTNH
ncbi:MAG: PAS domain-containing protein, partial [Fuerstiella sp.]|nr:PAS domain-containing protein [Fuerstiella sp.]